MGWLKRNVLPLFFVLFVAGVCFYAINLEVRSNQHKDRCREAGGLVVGTYDNGWACADHEYRLIHVP